VRTCKRCSTEQEVRGNFSTYGKVCYACKRKAVVARDARSKGGPWCNAYLKRNREKWNAYQREYRRKKRENTLPTL